MLIYLASPKDRLGDINLSAERARLIQKLTKAGHITFDPLAGWNTPASDERVADVDLFAVESCDAILALWPMDITSVGVPIEIRHALSHDKRVAILTDAEGLGPFLSTAQPFPLSQAGEDEAITWLSGAGLVIVDDLDPKVETVPAVAVVEAYKTVSQAIGHTTTAITNAQIKAGVEGLINRVGRYQIEKGWAGDGAPERSVGEYLMLIVSELGEALEEFRDDRPLIYYKHAIGCFFNGHEGNCFQAGDPDVDLGPPKPEGLAVEVADAIVRIAGFAADKELPLAEALMVKLAYNDTRPHRHGGKTL